MTNDVEQYEPEKKSTTNTDGYRIFPQLLAGFSANLIFLSVGMAFGWASPSLPKLLDKDSEVHLSSSEGAWVVSALQMGACIGPVVSALLVDRIGRKWFLYLTAIPTLISWILTYNAKSFAWFAAARFINGLGVGAVYSTVPIYLGEIAENRIRGALGTMSAMLVSAGSLSCYCLGPWISGQSLAMIATIPSILFLIFFGWMPESPYYYLKKKNPKAAEESLMWLRGTDFVDDELKEMAGFIEEQRKFRGRIWELLTVPTNRRATLIIVIVLSAQQLCGLTAILSYMSLLFRETSLDMNPNVAVIITAVISLSFNMLATFVVDKLGRKPLLIISSCGICLCLSIIAAYFHLVEVEYDVTEASWVPMMCVVSYFIFFSLGLGPVPYAILAEIYPNSVKPWATMVASIYGSILGVFVAKLYQFVVDPWGHFVIFYIFAFTEFFFAILILVIVPETKGKSFKEIQEFLKSSTKRQT